MFDHNETLQEARERNVRDALFEDVGVCDWTAQLVPAGQRVKARLIVREEAVLCGREWFEACLFQLDPKASIKWAYDEGTRYTTSSIHYHEIPCSADAMAALAKAHKTTVNTLMTAIVGNTFLALAQNDPKAAAAIRISVDLRRYYPKGTAPEFGNFVHSFTVLARRQATLDAQIHSLEGQVKAHLTRYARRDYALPLLFYELLPLLGRALFSYLIMRSKAKGSLPTLSCHLSNLGACEFINPKDARIRLHELWPATLSTVFLIGAVILNGKQFLCLTHQNDEIPVEAVNAFRAEFDRQIQTLVTEMPTP